MKFTLKYTSLLIATIALLTIGAQSEELSSGQKPTNDASAAANTRIENLQRSIESYEHGSKPIDNMPKVGGRSDLDQLVLQLAHEVIILQRENIDLRKRLDGLNPKKA